MKTPKYSYWYVIQGNYGYGWDDLDNYLKTDTSFKQLKEALKNYRINEPKASHRVISRRILQG